MWRGCGPTLRTPKTWTCLQRSRFASGLPGAEETTPFGPEVLVYKVAGKMFALTVPDDVPARMNLKCDPDRAVELRDRHRGDHAGISHEQAALEHRAAGRVGARATGAGHDRGSYALVVRGLTRKQREALGE